MAFVIITGKAGANAKESTLCMIDTIVKSNAIKISENNFRREHNLSTNVALFSKIVFQGTKEEATDFYNRVVEKIEEELR